METVGGYRLIRRLGAGERAEVFLGHAVSDVASASASAAIKVYRSGVTPANTDDEITVLAATHSPHLLRLIDVATAPDGRPSLVLPRLSGGSLARLLADRGTIAVGEAVTILAPLCDAVSELHEARGCHGAIRPGAVLFDDRGAPVLACFGSASTFGTVSTTPGRGRVTAAELSAEPRVVADLARLGALAGVVLSRASSADKFGGELLDWLRDVEPALEAHTFAAELRERLFALAPAVPIERFASDRSVPRPIVTRAVEPSEKTSSGVLRAEMPADGAAKQSGRNRRRDRAALGRERLAGLLVRPHAIISLLARAWAAVASTRKSFRVIAIAGIIAVVLAVLLVPSTARSDPAAVPTPRATRAESPGQDAGNRTAVPTSQPTPAVDDPVAAVQELLKARDRCIRTLSVSCLDAVDQQGSSALDDDSYLIRSLQQGVATASSEPLGGAKASLSERLGDSALLTLEVPTSGELSLLLVKQQSGWRIRDFLPG